MIFRNSKDIKGHDIDDKYQKNFRYS